MAIQRVVGILLIFGLCFGIEITETSVIRDSEIENPIKLDGGHNSGGLIIGIVGGIIPVLVIIFCAIYWYRRCRRQTAKQTELEEVIVHNSDVTDINPTPKDKPLEEARTRDHKHVPSYLEALTVLKRTTEEAGTYIKKMAQIPDWIPIHGKLKNPVAITHGKKHKDPTKKKRFGRLGSFLKIRRRKQANSWLKRRRERILKKQKKRQKMRRKPSCFCCR
ncbi:uncharacterized protein [Dendropsophus ebraccatus]|uniref:uncharacterized protein n=1 Tax=Dendropsophus ebraccatus TaxID=150705 RepID=UPI0038316204